jgi:exodeoxyribonuclease VII large subunit
MNTPLFPMNGPPSAPVLTVGELTRQVKEVVEGGFPSVWVSGEVSNVSRPQSGHIYLTLKDAEATLRTVIYRGIALRLRFDLRDGLEVIARGRLSVYVPQGSYQLTVEELQPRGIGPLELAFQQLREKLLLKGYFDPKRKRPLPRFPRRVILVTSPTGAAVRDMIEILGRRWPSAEVWICPVPVQGEGAGLKIAEAMGRLNRVQGIDVLIVGRGGGSLEDLWAFNEECVARAIHSSRIPVISAVGHETDVTIADLVADVRAATPSEAAERVVPNREEEMERLRSVGGGLRTLLVQQVQRARLRLDDLSRQRTFRLPLERLRDRERRLDDLGQRLQRAMKQRTVLMQQKLEATAGRLESLSPLNVLSRGYSLTRTADERRVIRSSEEVQPGDRLETLVQQGRLVSRVESVARS